LEPKRNNASVSVVVPSYNHAQFIARCLRSIIGQTHRPLELIVIDDGSVDGSVAHIERELKNCPFDSELIARPHRGLATTLNEGLERSRGEYFAYLGSDDMWMPRFLESRVNLLQRRPNAVMAYGHAFVINADDEILESSKDWAPYSDTDARKMLLRHIVPFSPSVLYRREALERHRWNKDAGLEDYDLYLRLSNDGEFALDTEVLCAWRSHGNNKSCDLDFMLAECLAAQQRAVNFLKLTPAELKRAQSNAKWRYAGDFSRSGQKLKALRLICLNLGGAPSYHSAGKMIVSLTFPMSVLRWRRRMVEKRSRNNYASIKLNEGQSRVKDCEEVA
jgi:alpha-1,3-rhamnosyltransferase